MNPELIVIDTLKGIKELCAYLLDKEYVAFDCETTGLSKYDKVIGFSVCAEESKAFYIVLEKFENGKLIPMQYYGAEALLMCILARKKIIAHNSIFDSMMAEYALKCPIIQSIHTDTMLLAHLLNENRKVGLKELASSLFGEDSKQESLEMKESVLKNGGRLTKKQYEMWKCDTNIMAKYGAKDAWLTYKLFLYLVPILYEQGLDKFFYEDETMPLLRGPTYELNTVGLEVDVQGLTTLKKELEAECAELKQLIYAEIQEKIKDRPKFSITSNQQLSWLLFEAYNLEFKSLTKSGKKVCHNLGMTRLPYTFKAKKEFIHCCRTAQEEKYRNPWKYTTADKKVLQEYSHKYKWIKYLLEYTKKKKLLSTYVKGIEDRMQYGLIQPNYLMHGTSSGRYSSRNPNFQNLPRDDKRIKQIIKSRKGKIFVGADQSSLEPRVFSSISGDERLCKAFNEGLDFYSTVGQEVYGKFDCLPLKEGKGSFGETYPKLRQDAKTFSLASTYGATGYQLFSLMGKPPHEVQEDIDRYFEAFPKVQAMMKESHKLAKSQGFVTSLFGRPRRIPEAKKIDRIYRNAENLPYEARSLLNLAVNHRIQSTAASIMNRAAIRLYKYLRNANLDAKFVAQVHDSLVIECDEKDAAWVASLMQDAMENACTLPGVKLEAKPKIGLNLSEV